MRWLQECAHLGLPEARKGAIQSKLPEGSVAEINTRTKDARGIGVLVGGKPHLIAAPASWWTMRQITKDYVELGGHPDDLLVWDYDPATDAVTTIRTAPQHLLWTASDQRRLEDGLKK